MLTRTPLFPPTPAGWCIVGHRGAAALEPENTLAGFARAVALAVDAVELDVHLVDGELVVIHDDTVDRTTDGTGAVAELSLAELRALDAGDGQTIPLLNDVLADVPANVGINVELKGDGTARPTAERLGGLDRPLLVSSFDHAELRRFHAACPHIPCAPLFSRWRSPQPGGARGASPRWMSPLATAARLDATSINISDRIATADRVAAIRERGFACMVYTVNDPERARELRGFGASGVFTDCPDRVCRDDT